MRKLLITTSLILSILASSCSTVKPIVPALPDYKVTVPERPQLKRVEGEVPREVVDNLISLTGHIEKLEIIIDGWENFYDGLKEIYKWQP